MKLLNGTPITSQAVIEDLKRRDWEAIADMWYANDDHGLSFIPADQWAALRDEARNDGVDLDALKEEAKQW